MPTTPADVFTALLTGITERRFEDLFQLYADDCVVEVPFATPVPLRLVGNQALRQHFSDADRMPLEMTADNVVVHQTADPEVIIAEWDYRIRATTTGKELTASNIQVLQVRDGKIVSSRDYHNHAAIAAALT